MPDIIVKNQTELDAAIKAARGGETILLAPGTYTSILMTNINPSSGITIKSQDTTKPATVGQIWMTSSSNITLKDMDIVRTWTPSTDAEIANRIMGSNNITVDGLRFSGGSGDPSNSKGTGLMIRGGTNNKFVNSTMDHYYIGLSVRAVDGMLVQGNSFQNNRMDHTNFAEMKNVTIDNNYFEGLYPINGEHPDAIQFFTRNMSAGNTNVNISNNVIMQGAGLGTQGILLGEETGVLPYNNVNIDNNLVYLSGMYHGILVVNGQNVNVRSNSVLSIPDGTPNWIRLDNVTGSASGNVADQINIAGNSQVTSSNNIDLGGNPQTMRAIADLAKGSKATVYGLMVDGFGYAPVPGSTMARTVAAQRAAALALPVAPKLLLDLNFSTNGGMVDLSSWSTDDPVKALNTAAISGKMLKVSTGSGVELARPTSKQLYALPAFTLNFDLKRDGVTAPVGQVMGIYKSWNITLRADGELVFEMTNTAGKTSTLVTSGANIRDTATHKIALSYDGVKGTASMYVDGVVRGTAAMSGTTQYQQSWGLYVGSPFSLAFSGSVGDVEMRDAALTSAQIQTLNAGGSLTGTVPTQTPAQAAEVLKVMVAKGVAANAATLAGADTSWGRTMTSPATLSFASAFGASALSQSPLAVALANATSPLASGTTSFSTLTASRAAALNLYHA